MGMTAPKLFRTRQNLADAQPRRPPIVAAMLAQELCADCGQQQGLAIGGCGCGGGGGMAGGNGTLVGTGRGNTMAHAATSAANMATVAAALASNPLATAAWTELMMPSTGCYPRGACDQRGVMTSGWNRALAEVGWRSAPYQDVEYDFANMDVLYSEQVTLLPGVATAVNVSPNNGTFAAFYYTIAVVDPTTQMNVVDWTFDQPSVVGCPQPCDVGGGDAGILSVFAQRVAESCKCGTPLAAWLDRNSEGSPLETLITNRQAAGNLTAQIQVRGYCCSTKIC